MKVLIIVLCILSIFTSCNKSNEDSSATTEAELIESLNTKNINDSRTIFQSLSDELTAEKRAFYSAQINSLEADIDIYSLFKIVKMELFEFAMTEWGNISRYNKVVQTQAGTVFGSASKREAREEELKEEIKLYKQLDPLSLDLNMDLVGHDRRYNGQSYYCTYYLILSERDVEDSKKYTYDYSINGNFDGDSDLDCSFYDDSVADVQISDIQVYFYNTKYNTLKQELAALVESKTTNQGVKLLMSLYQSAKVIMNVPDINSNRFEYVNLALDDLNLILHTPDQRLRDNANKQTALLAGYLILGALKNSIDFSAVESPLDIVCRVDASRLIGNYNYFLSGFKSLYNVIIGTEFSKKNDKSIKSFKKYLDLAPEVLEQNEKNNHVRSIQKYQETSGC